MASVEDVTRVARKAETLAGFYQDSVVLMRISAQVRARAGVREVALFMGTPANRALLEQAGLATEEGRKAGPNDLIITAVADDERTAADAIGTVKALLSESAKTRQESSPFRPRSIDSALRGMPDANLAAISIPGVYVRAEAMAALRRNLHLFIFSDNVSVEDEIALKDEAIRRGLFCMGPDQGTAYLGGIGLGFANLVRRGRVGCVAASGTGLQTLACRLDSLGEGVSSAIGVGGRDLSQAVAGRMTFFALDALAADPSTEAIVLISKPPHASVLESLHARLEAIGKPTVVCCVGAAPRRDGKAVWVDTLAQAADAAVALLAGKPWKPALFSDAQEVARRIASLEDLATLEGRRIVGLYTGGTLAYETGHVLNEAFGRGHAHRVLDLGDDAYTVGRPHPMIDPRARTEQIVAAAAEPDVGVLLLDIVLGTGAHENPAEPVAAAVTEARRIAAAEGRRLAAVASIIGTPRDPQGLPRQAAVAEQAGIALLPTNADAARFAAMLASAKLRRQWLPASA